MKVFRSIRMIAVSLFVLLLAVTLAMPGGFAQEPAPQAVASTTAFSSAGTLSFQGEVTDLSGNPLTGNYNMRFAIYDAATGGTRRWPAFSSHEEHSGVPVNKGLFNVLLGSQDPVTAGMVDDGGDRYLQIWVCTTAGSSCTSYDDLGRLPLSSVVYGQAASTFLPGATVSTSSGTALTLTSGDTSKPTLNVEASATSGTSAAVTGIAKSPNGGGLAGYNDSSGIGVFGNSSSGTGLWGQSNGNNGYGVYGTAPGGGTSLHFPPGAVTANTTVTYTLLAGPSTSLSSVQAMALSAATTTVGKRTYAGHAFHLDARDDTGSTVAAFSRPVTITLRYQDADWQAAGIADETTLNLAYWDEGAGEWVTLLPYAGCSLDTTDNRLVVMVDRPGEVVLYGMAETRVYLPFVR